MKNGHIRPKNAMAVIVLKIAIIAGKQRKGKKMIDFKDLISRKEVIRQVTELLENIPSAFAEEEKRPDPKGNHRFEDIEKWEHENGIRKWKDRHHL